MHCPKCVGVLEKQERGRIENRPVEIDVCPMCSGIWFDGGELTRILGLKVKWVETAESFVRRDGGLESREADCPRCKTRMDKVSSMQDSRILLDNCPQCNGFWLDGGKLSFLQRGNIFRRFLRKIGNHFRDVFSGGRSDMGRPPR